MKNITEYNEFIKLNKANKLNEELDIDTGKAGGGGDMYFANVKGNLAGAENTLVGAAALKLLGFIKRKGMQMYMKRVLKPKLGRIYMNGILRYANKEGIGNFARKKYFNINKIEEGESVKYEQDVTFIYESVNGLPSFKMSATVKRKDGELLEDGEYLLVYNNGKFKVKDGKIIEIEEGSEIKDKKLEEKEPQEEVDTTVSEEEFEDYKKKSEKELEEAEKIGVKPEKWVTDEIQSIKSKLDTNVNTIDDLDDEKIQKEKTNLERGIDILNKSIEEINEIIKKGGDGIENIDDIRWQRLVYMANVKELINLSNFLNDLLTEYNKKSSTSKKKPVPRRSKIESDNDTIKSKKESYLYEAEEPVVVTDTKLKKQDIAPTKKGKVDIKTDRLGDELQEIASSGDAIDLNDEDFYKQFESEEARKGVTEEILKNKPAIAKIQLAAERIIGGNAKQQNAWDRMVENVKSMYSKYIITDLVDPKNILKNVSDSDIEKYKKEQMSSKDGQNLKGIEQTLKLDKISLWENNTRPKKALGESFNNSEYLISNIFINKIHDYYVIQRVKKVNGLYFYRLIGLFDMDKLIENSEKYNDGTLKDFTDGIVKIGIYSKFLSPIKTQTDDEKQTIEKTRDGGRLVTLYLVSETALTFGSNANVAIMYLYSEKTDTVKFNKQTTFYTLKKVDEKSTAIRLPKEYVSFDKRNYTFAVSIQTTNSRQITDFNIFGIDANQQFDIDSEISIKKMKGIETIYKK
jgi:hypothetical protein